jgi:hypothetical protein
VICRFDVDATAVPPVIRIAGRLTEVHVPDFLTLWQELKDSRASDAPSEIRIDLGDLVSADAIGMEALRRVGQAGAVLINVPNYIRMMLHGTGLSDKRRDDENSAKH